MQRYRLLSMWFRFAESNGATCPAPDGIGASAASGGEAGQHRDGASFFLRRADRQRHQVGGTRVGQPSDLSFDLGLVARDNQVARTVDAASVELLERLVGEAQADGDLRADVGVGDVTALISLLVCSPVNLPAERAARDRHPGTGLRTETGRPGYSGPVGCGVWRVARRRS